MTPGAAGSEPWFPFGVPDLDAPLRVFCLPYAGGGAGLYRSWQQRAAAGAALAPVQLPGRETRLREPPVEDFETLVTRLAGALGPWTGDRYALFGHSMGGLLAHELAYRLEELTGRPPELLAVSACAAPELERPRPAIHQLPREEFVAELRRLEGTPAEVLEDDELLDLCIPRIRADFAVLASHRHRPRAPLNSRITAFCGTRDPQIPVWSMEAWRGHTTRDFRLHLMDDDHFFIHRHEAAVFQHLVDGVRAVLGDEAAGVTSRPDERTSR
ncbi:thioesterase domain-containing protein [Streptomyces sp. NBC_00190]|uniref:thioesterase II family protein n=1 Tax=unclassified Streptomyces TaxID=2593676 RepID=UPI002E291407|nr:alpha/beta fold hydrolase [Streptomyces sp. NBC_00190]WSZ37626.1 thioesterase domain-containing protein [Streptomyces sp. NBC_00868]